ncbi:MAG: hypothetical protein K6F72_01310 [Bacteroidales bacterium]|nr:hypothetical protein [Bacteroidales bacterium]
MKRFLLKVFVPSLLLIVAIVALWEGVLHVLPNEHLYKSRWMDNHAEQVQLLVLGSSNTDRAVMPSELGLGRGFSCAGSSQDIQNDSWILHLYIDRMDSLRYVILDLNYLAPLHSIDYSDDYVALRKGYRIYWGNPKYIVKWWEWPEVSHFNWLAWYKDFVAEKDTIYADGFMSRPNDTYNENDWRYYAWMTAKDHTVIDDSNAARILEINVDKLRCMATTCRERGVKMVMVTCPVHEFFYSQMDQRQVDLLHRVADSLCKEFPNVSYMDFMMSPLFTAEDMSNANHLNRRGALRFSQMVGDSIRRL